MCFIVIGTGMQVSRTEYIRILREGRLFTQISITPQTEALGFVCKPPRLNYSLISRGNIPFHALKSIGVTETKWQALF